MLRNSGIDFPYYYNLYIKKSKNISLKSYSNELKCNSNITFPSISNRKEANLINSNLLHFNVLQLRLG